MPSYCSVIVDKKFSSTICISKSVFPKKYLFLSVFFQSVFIQSVFLRNIPNLRVFSALRVYFAYGHMAIWPYGHMAIGSYATNMGKWGIPGKSYKNVAQQC